MLLTHAHADHLSFDSLERLPRDIPLVRAAGVARWLRAPRLRPRAVDLAPGERARRTVYGARRERDAPRQPIWVRSLAQRGEHVPARRRRDDVLRRRYRARRRHAPSGRARAVGERPRARSRAAADRLRAVVEAGVPEGASHARRRAHAVRAVARAGARAVSLGNVSSRHGDGARRDRAACASGWRRITWLTRSGSSSRANRSKCRIASDADDGRHDRAARSTCRRRSWRRRRAPGRGALAVVRLSGARGARYRARCRRPLADDAHGPPCCHRARRQTGVELDQSVVVRYDAPASFTGEDAVEIMTHGGLVVPTTVVAALVARGARLAEPGEFTRRAVLNGKLDILQAEATGDLVASSSRAAQRVALRQLDGGLSRRVLAAARRADRARGADRVRHRFSRGGRRADRAVANSRGGRRSRALARAAPRHGTRR